MDDDAGDDSMADFLDELLEIQPVVPVKQEQAVDVNVAPEETEADAKERDGIVPTDHHSTPAKLPIQLTTTTDSPETNGSTNATAKSKVKPLSAAPRIQSKPAPISIPMVTPPPKKMNKRNNNVTPRYMTASANYVVKSRNAITPQQRRPTSNGAPTPNPRVPSTNGTYIWERSKQFQEIKQRRIAQIESSMMQECTFQPNKNRASPKTADSTTGVSVFDRLASAATTAIHITRAQKPSTPRSTVSSVDSIASSPRIIKLYSNGHSKLRSKRMTMKEEDEARRKRIDAQDLARCTFRPNTQWNLAAERRRRAAQNRDDDDGKKLPATVSISERERLDRQRRQEEAELVDHCTFTPKTKWDIRTERALLSTDDAKAAGWDKSFYDDNTDSTIKRRLPLEISTGSGTPRRMPSGAISPLATPDVSTGYHGGRSIQSNEESIPEGGNESSTSLHVPELKKTGRDVNLAADTTREDLGRNHIKPQVVRSNYVGAVSPSSPVWKEKYRKVVKEKDEEIFTAQGRGHAENVQLRGSSRIDAGGKHTPTLSPVHTPANRTASMESVAKPGSDMDAVLKMPTLNSNTKPSSDPDTEASPTFEVGGFKVAKNVQPSLPEPVMENVGGFKVAKKEMLTSSAEQIGGSTVMQEVVETPKKDQDQTISEQSPDATNANPSEPSSTKKSWTERILGKREKRQQEKTANQAEGESEEVAIHNEPAAGNDAAKKAAEAALIKAKQDAAAVEAMRLKVDEELRVAAESEAARLAEANKAEAARLAQENAEQEARIKAEIEAKLAAEAEAVRRAQEKATEDARMKAEQKAEAARAAQTKLAEEQATAEREAAAISEAKLQAEKKAIEDARTKAEQEAEAARAKRKADEIAAEETRLKAEAEAQVVRLAEEKASQAARIKEEEEARIAQEARHQVEQTAQEKSRAEAEAAKLAQQKIEEEVRLKAEEDARKEAEKLRCEEEARMKAEASSAAATLLAQISDPSMRAALEQKLAQETGLNLHTNPTENDGHSSSKSIEESVHVKELPQLETKQSAEDTNEKKPGRAKKWLERITRRAKGSLGSGSGSGSESADESNIGEIAEMEANLEAKLAGEVAAAKQKADEAAQNLQIEEEKKKAAEAAEAQRLQAERKKDEEARRLQEETSNVAHQEAMRAAAEEERLQDEEAAQLQQLEEEEAQLAAEEEAEAKAEEEEKLRIEAERAEAAAAAAALLAKMANPRSISPKPRRQKADGVESIPPRAEEKKKKPKSSDRAKKWKERMAKKTRSNESMDELAEAVKTSKAENAATHSAATSEDESIEPGEKKTKVKSDRAKKWKERLAKRSMSPKRDEASTVKVDAATAGDADKVAYPRVLYSDGAENEAQKEPEFGSI